MNLFKRKKLTTIISKKITEIEHMNFATHYLGKKVFSQSGEKIGIIKDVVFEKGAHKGFLLNKKLFIDKEHFNKEFDKALMLQMEPVTSIVGKLVFDANGKKVGKVKDIERATNENNYKTLLVRKNIFSKPLLISKSKVSITKTNVILNVAIEK